MTTGRINQITIVWPGVRPPAPRGRRRVKLLLGGIHEGRAARSTYGLSHRHHARQSAFPLSLPRASVDLAKPAGGKFGLDVPGGGHSARVQPLRRPSNVIYLLMLCFKACQRPVIHRTHMSASRGVSPWRLHAFSVRREA
jgi:hypothetical protein